ncbi:MAG: hypothetical protein VKL01_08960 [Limnothrix sp.]|nr:hypothetical protein [Limnothrix sp.]
MGELSPEKLNEEKLNEKETEQDATGEQRRTVVLLYRSVLLAALGHGC